MISVEELDEGVIGTCTGYGSGSDNGRDRGSTTEGRVELDLDRVCINDGDVVCTDTTDVTSELGQRVTSETTDSILHPKMSNGKEATELR
jgi:hypothetical protein